MRVGRVTIPSFSPEFIPGEKAHDSLWLVEGNRENHSGGNRDSNENVTVEKSVRVTQTI